MGSSLHERRLQSLGQLPCEYMHQLAFGDHTIASQLYFPANCHHLLRVQPRRQEIDDVSWHATTGKRFCLRDHDRLVYKSTIGHKPGNKAQLVISEWDS